MITVERLAQLSPIAGAIAAYRRDGVPVPDDAPRWDLRSEDEADAVRDLFAEMMGEPVVGWKIGAPDAAAQGRLNLTRPFLGRVFASRLWQSPAALDRAMFPECIPESEIAFRLGRDLPARGKDYTTDAIIAAVSDCVLAYEIVDFARPRRPESSSFDFVADNGGCGGLVVGPPLPDWQSLDLLGRAVDLRFDGKTAAEGKIGKPLRGLLDLVTWLANHLPTIGTELKAGQYVTTGNWTGMPVLKPGQKSEAVYEGLGSLVAVLG